MSPDAAWKAFERYVAKEMGGERRGADYRDASGGKNDIILQGWSIECKKLARPLFSDLRNAIKQAEEAAKAGDVSLAIVSKKNQAYDKAIVCMSIRQLQNIKVRLDMFEMLTRSLSEPDQA